MEKMLEGIKAIADENRLKIIRLLLNKDYCVRALAKKLEISESAVSQHLKTLREAGLVIGVKKGYFVHYKVERENLRSIGDYIIDLEEEK
jgi:ArsR family transcriptional regulator, arsenate/arsenite/antimonite-responsive transcriptional repressor